MARASVFESAGNGSRPLNGNPELILKGMPMFRDNRHDSAFHQIGGSMTRTTVNFDTVRSLGLALPGVEEGGAHGFPALKAHGKLLAWVPTHRSAEPGSLGVRVDFDDRDGLLAAAPDVYYVTEHYVDYNSVLVRLSRVDSDVLRGLLAMAYKFVTRSAAPRPPSPKRRRPRSGK